MITYFSALIQNIQTAKQNRNRSSCVRRHSVKKVFLTFFQNSKENTCARDLFNKVAGLRSATLLKKSLWHRCFPMNFVQFLRTFFSYRSPLVAASAESTERQKTSLLIK